MDESAYGQVLQRLARFFDTEKSGSVPFRRDDYSLEALRNYLREQGALRSAEHVFHVAGTKGKGSVTTLLTGLIREHGWSVGSYLSPHLVSYRERIRVDGEGLAPGDFAAWLTKVLEEKPNPEGSPIRSVFEALTAAMALSFRSLRLKAAVIEVGLGGRLDATNVLETDVSIITPVSFDHMEVLGSTLEEIAAEKAGILRPGHPVLIGRQTPEALKSIEKKATELGAPLRRLGKDFEVEESGSGWKVGLWDGTTVDGLRPAMQGKFQAENVALALAAFATRFGKLQPELTRRAIGRTRIRGRLEEITLPDGCRIVLDGAHNPLASGVLAEELRNLYQPPFTLMLAVSSNKDADGILEPLLPLVDNILLTSFGGPRAREPRSLLSLLRNSAHSVQLLPNVREAWESWKAHHTPSSVLLVTGSLFLVGRMLQLLHEEGITRLDPAPDPEFP